MNGFYKFSVLAEYRKIQIVIGGNVRKEESKMMKKGDHSGMHLRVSGCGPRACGGAEKGRDARGGPKKEARRR